MKCPYNEQECVHLGKENTCKINTCYDEYDMAENKPFPNIETKKYWERISEV